MWYWKTKIRFIVNNKHNNLMYRFVFFSDFAANTSLRESELWITLLIVWIQFTWFLLICPYVMVHVVFWYYTLRDFVFASDFWVYRIYLHAFQPVKQEERTPWWGMWISWWWAHQATQALHAKDTWFLMRVLRVVSIHLQ